MDFLAGCFGTLAGGAIGVALTFPLLSGTGSDALVWLAAFLFFGLIGAALGSLLGLGVRRLTIRSAKALVAGCEQSRRRLVVAIALLEPLADPNAERARDS